MKPKIFLNLRSNLLRAFVALTLSAAPLQAANEILNGAFASGTAPWTIGLGSGGAATLANDSGTGRVTISSGGSSKSIVTLDQLLDGPLVNGVTYTIEFDARAAAGKPIDVMIRNSSTIFYAVYNVSVGTTFAHTTLTYTHSAADVAGARLSLRVGGNNTTIWLDNVEVTFPEGASSQLISKVNGVWTFPTKTLGGKDWNAGTFDFSYAGYNYGERESMTGIPAASVTISAADYEDITDKIQAALNSATLAGGGTVHIPAGIFYIGRNKQEKAIVISRDNTLIKGANPGETTLIVDKSYHPKPLSDTVKNRQEATFASGVITFVKTTPVNGQSVGSGDWFYGSTASNAATVSAAVPLGAKTITISDPSSTLSGNLDTIMIRQIMWQSFVEAWAFNHSHDPKPWRWCSYNTDGTPSFTDPSFSFCYYRKVLSRNGNVLTLDIPIPHELNPAHAPVAVIKKTPSYQLHNCGLQDLTFTAEEEQNGGATLGEESLGCTIQISGVYNGLFKNVNIESFRNLGFGTAYPVNVTFLNCRAANAQNCGGGGAGYGFYVRGQNLLYKNCQAFNVRHGYTTAASQTSNIVIKNCSADTYRFASDATDGESVDDTHLQYAHGLLWDNHYSRKAGLLLIPRRELSPKAYETCGWAIVWNYKNEGINDKLVVGTQQKDIRHNLIGVNPTEFGLVIGAHAGAGPNGIRVMDGYTRRDSATFHYPEDLGTAVTTPDLQVGTKCPVLFEHTGSAVAESLYDIMLAKRGVVVAP